MDVEKKLQKHVILTSFYNHLNIMDVKSNGCLKNIATKCYFDVILQTFECSGCQMDVEKNITTTCYFDVIL